MSTFPFQANVAHAQNIRRVVTARHTNEMNTHLGVEHIPCLQRAKSSDARLDTLGDNYGFYKNMHHNNLSHQQSKSEMSVAKSTENVISAFSRPEAWNLTFGSQDGPFKLDKLAINPNGNLNSH